MSGAHLGQGSHGGEFVSPVGSIGQLHRRIPHDRGVDGVACGQEAGQGGVGAASTGGLRLTS